MTVAEEDMFLKQVQKIYPGAVALWCVRRREYWIGRFDSEGAWHAIRQVSPSAASSLR